MSSSFLKQVEIHGNVREFNSSAEEFAPQDHQHQREGVENPPRSSGGKRPSVQPRGQRIEGVARETKVQTLGGAIHDDTQEGPTAKTGEQYTTTGLDFLDTLERVTFGVKEMIHTDFRAMKYN